MRRILFFLILGVGLQGCAPEPSYGAFDLSHLSPIATALNGAYSSLGEEPWALLYNPAQIVRLRDSQTSFSYSKPAFPFSELETHSFSGIYTRNCMNIAFGVGAHYLDTNVFYREFTGLLSLGQRFGEKEDPWDLGVGSNLKLYSLKRGDPAKTDDPALTPKSVLKLSGDMGVHLRIENIYVGLSFNNLIPANIGLTETENIPMEFRVGLGGNRIWKFSQITLSPALEFVKQKEEGKWIGGTKMNLFHFLEIQLGIDKNSLGMGFTVPVQKNSDSDTTIYLSASYLYPLQLKENFGSPMVGITLIF